MKNLNQLNEYGVPLHACNGIGVMNIGGSLCEIRMEIE